MIGSGIFTTTGFQVSDVPSLPAILIAWLIGGAVAFCGAAAYAELSAALPRNGGEYQILTELFHPALGFLSACVSLVVGFCAPIAVTALVFSNYLRTVIPDVYRSGETLLPPGGVQSTVAVGLVVVLTMVHLLRVEHGSRFQNLFTILKVSMLAALIIGGLARGDLTRITGDTRPIAAAMLTPAFAIGLIYISYSYTGWNAAAYVAGEIQNPGRNLPIALCAGTLLVTLLYLGLNVMFLAAVPREELAGVETVAHAAIEGLYGRSAGQLVSLLIVLGLVSMAGALIMTGARVYETVGQDYLRLRWLAARRSGSGPWAALLLQSIVAVLLIVIGNVQSLIEYAGFMLSLFSGLTVCGVFLLRRRTLQTAAAFRMPGHPLTSLVFVGLMAWIIGVTMWQRPQTALAGLGTLIGGGVLYLCVGRRETANDESG